MYGPVIAAWLNGELEKNPKKEDTDKPRWFSCIPCDIVQWMDVGLRSHCFVCGKWGKRGQWRK